MSAPLAVRNATAADYAAFARLFPELGVDDPLPTPAAFERKMVATAVIAEREEAAIGFAYFQPMEHSCHLSIVITAPEARRTGVGRALMTEAIARAKAAGCAAMTLNVKPDNAGAIALYESFGFARHVVGHSLRIHWSVVDAWPPSAAPHAADAFEVGPADDARIEQAAGLARGLFANKRARATSVIVAIEREPAGTAVAVFDPTFPGAHPFRAPDPTLARSLVRALRSHVRPEDPWANLFVDDGGPGAEALLAAGATLRMSVLGMRAQI